MEVMAVVGPNRPGNGRSSQVDAEDHDQDHREPEDGHAYPRERDDRGDLVEERVLPYGAYHPDGHPDEDGDEHGEGRELEAWRGSAPEAPW